MTRRRWLGAAGAAALAAAWGRQAAGSEPDHAFAGSLVFDALSNDAEWTREVWEAARRAGVTGIHTSLAHRSLLEALRDLAIWQARFDAHPDRLVKVRHGGEIAAAHRDGRIAVVLGFQNATLLEGDASNLETVYALGTRCIQLTYNSRNLLGDGCTERTNAGLSDFGIEVVESMNRLGIAVDLSHCGERTAADAIAASRRPPAFTHTMCRAVYDHVRAKSDEQIRALSDKGGVTGIVALGYFVGPDPDTDLDDYLDHVDHAVRVGGIDHVGLATDFSLRGIQATATRESWYEPRLRSFKPSYRVRWPPWIPELDGPDRFRNLARALARRGRPAREIEKLLGGNWSRYFAETLA